MAPVWRLDSDFQVLTTGNQLRAARALVGLDQEKLAKRAGLNVNTIRAMEARGASTLTSGLDTIRAVMEVLEAAGVEFLDEGRPGVRLSTLPLKENDGSKITKRSPVRNQRG